MQQFITYFITVTTINRQRPAWPRGCLWGGSSSLEHCRANEGQLSINQLSSRVSMRTTRMRLHRHTPGQDMQSVWSATDTPVSA